MSSSWWQSGVVYQIYPRSFLDSNGDGVGDLRGITRQLPYCAELGVDAIWLSPIYPSPMADFGYDIADYTGIAPLFGSMEDFDRLVLHANAAGLKLILDFVPNHTSNQHPWFKNARSSCDSAQRDWYLWRDPAPDGGPPNNWLSNFGGSAWTLDAATGQYYYHSFLAAQPDLNWRNPKVVAAMHEVMRFWLRKGVAGFRIDVLWMLIKDAAWRDNPPNPHYQAGRPAFESQLALYTTDRPEMMEIVAGLRRVADEFQDRVLIGEIYLPLERLVAYYGTALNGVQLPFNFNLLQCDWTAPAIKQLIDRYEALLPVGAWPNWVLGNHDRPRVATRVGPEQARVAAMLLLTLRGTPTIYYGEELGMQNVAIPAARVQDPLELNVPGKGLGRDPCRTPMQWDETPGAGFSAGEPWLPVADDSERVNVRMESGTSSSMLRLYRRLLALRRAHAALTLGDYAPLQTTGNILAYVRRTPQQRLLILLNLGPRDESYALASDAVIQSRLLSTHPDIQHPEGLHPDRPHSSPLGSIALRPNEGLVFRLQVP